MIHRALLACSFVLLFSTLSAQQSEDSSKFAPKLLEAIDDQTLFLNPKNVDVAGQVSSRQVYVRDLNLSFGESPDQRFSAYPYDTAVAEAWIVENYLIVLAKSTGSAQIAVTASNEFGSMIDWFIVHVEERTDESNARQAEVITQPKALIVSVPSTGEVDTQLLDASRRTAIYRIVPDLPTGLIYEEGENTIRGRVDGALPTSTYYWIGVADRSAVIQQFTFALQRGSEIETRQSNAGVATLSFDESLSAIAVDLPSLVGNPTSTPRQTTATRRVAASRPVRPQSGSDVSIHRNLLYGVTNAMHSRFREITLYQASSDSNEYTLWNYASSRYGASPSSTGAEPTGIYVGFDTQLEDNLTTGLTIGFDRQGYTTDSLRTTNSSHNYVGSSLSSILPYAKWQDGSGAEIWGILGVARDFSRLETVQSPGSDLRNRNLLLGAVGWRHSLGSSGNVQLATVGDAGLTIPLRTDPFDSDTSLWDQISSRSVRAGLEMSYAGEQLQPYIGLSGRINSNPETRDASLEALGGIRYTSLGGLTFEAEGRAFSAEDEFDDPELVFSVAAHLDPGLRGEGLALSVAPMYGVNRSRALLSPNPSFGYSPYDDSRFSTSSQNAWAMSGSLSYGVPLRGTGVITPFGQIAISTLNQTRMGVRVALNSSLDRLFNLEIATVQSRFEQQKFDKGVDIQLRLVF